MKRHINVPIFIPHLGCPNDCVFCNQIIISGTQSFVADSVIPIIEESLKTVDEGAEIELAFFGGSFTGIDQELMEKLLIIGNSYLKQGRISSIRCSTRPDYINDEILSKLIDYGVGTVELGIQSMNDSVLEASKRGHTSEETRAAVKLIKARGLNLGGQMMIGLPGATSSDEIECAEFIASSCDEARIYPTLVFKGTELASFCDRGEYAPLSLDEAIERSAAVFRIFAESGVKVLRIGLCDSENLHSDETYYAGPNHAAMGELVVSEYYYLKLKEAIKKQKKVNNSVSVKVAVGHTSKLIGQHRKNKIRLRSELGINRIRVVESQDIPEYSLALEAEERT